MGRNGAGKSTLLRLAGRADRADPRPASTRGRPGGAAAAEPRRLLPARPRRRRRRRGARRLALADRHPRDVSGGERQRLALELVLATGEPPGGRLPRRADARHGPRPRRAPRRPAARARRRRRRGAGRHPRRRVRRRRGPTGRSCSATGAPVADAPTAEVLGGGWYFATQTARVLAAAARCSPRRARRCCAPRRRAGARGGAHVSWLAASSVAARPRARRRLRVVRALAPDRAGDRARRHAGRARRPRPDRVRADPERQADHRHRADLRLRARRRARVRGRGGGGAGVEPVLRPGPVDAVADGRRGAASALAGALLARVAGRELGRVALAAACAAAGARLRRRR